MFEKTLSDLVRGIRSHRGSEAQFISQCMSEIKKELKQGNIAVKANAISKLTYLQMLGYDITWAAFNIIEVMSSPRFTYKRIGYLAASQCFYDELDVVMLTTNMIKKDMSSPNQYESGLALNGLSCFVTPDIARDLANDVLTLTTSSKPYLKKKAIVVMYKIFLKFPDALRPAFPRLKSSLEDPDPSVQCAAVSVICELAQKNPKNYLSLAPTLFKLMNSSSNNWMLIKIIKLFGALCPLEPRLGKKLAEPLTSLIHSTSAMSLLYECISTVIVGLPNNNSALQLCVSKLRLFMEDADQNLKYLGLLAMSRIMQQQPKAVLQVKDIIMDCIEDKDESIRIRALELIMGMANKKNINDIVRNLLGHIDTAESTFFRDIVIEKIIAMCSYKGYAHITNFEWYITILVEMTRFEGTRHGKLIASQMLDVTIRVKDVRPFSVRQMATIVENTQLFITGAKNGSACEVLYAAAWIVGEFSEYLTNAQPILESLLHPQITDLPGHIQAVFVHNIVKLYASILVKAEAEGTTEAVEEVGAMLVEKLPVFMQSGDLEVQERACGILQLMKYIVKLQSKGAAVANELQNLFLGDLNPVAPKAQRKVPVPDGLDLDQWINEPLSESDDEDEMEKANFFFGTSDDTHRSTFNDKKKGDKKKKGKGKGKSKAQSDEENEEDDEEIAKAREQRRQEIENNPHYLKPSSATKPKPKNTDEEQATDQSQPAIKDIPVSKLELGIPLIIETTTHKEIPKKKGKKGKKRRGKQRDNSDDDTAGPSRPQVDTTAELPEGALESGDEETVENVDELTKKLNVNLDEPLRDDEVLPVRTHRVVKEPEQEPEEPTPKKSSKKTSKKGKKKKAAENDDETEAKEPKKKKSSKKEKREKEASPVALLNIGDEDEHESQPQTIEPPQEDRKDNTDDLEFWLSTSDVKTTEDKEEKEEVPSASPATVKSKGKKEKKSKGEKRTKSSKKSSKTVQVEEEMPTGGQGVMELLGFELEAAPTSEEPMTSFKVLSEDENLKMTYDVKASLSYNNQITVAVVFSNKTSYQLVSLDFNVLDSLNAKLDRPGGDSSHIGIPVPFLLLPGSANECQFTFIVQEFYMAQKLKGTVTYMIKSEDGTTQEKVDFKLLLPSSSFICPSPLPQDRFATLLSGGNLCDTVTFKGNLSKTGTFTAALKAIVTTLHLNIVEQIEDSASLYGLSIAGHHICLLVKATSDTQIGVSAKGSDSRLVSSLMDEVKNVI